MSTPRRHNAILATPLIWLVRLYQVGLSPLVGGRCRFTPSCSNYALDALRTHGAARGSYLATRRLLRCHPLGGSGYDPVPLGDDDANPTSPGVKGTPGHPDA